MGENEEWRKTADTTKMSSEEVKAAGVEASRRPPGRGPGPAGSTLHQRRSLPFSFPVMAVAGVLITAAVGYSVLYVKKKPEATAVDVAKVSVGVANPEDSRPENPEDTRPKK